MVIENLSILFQANRSVLQDPSESLSRKIQGLQQREKLPRNRILASRDNVLFDYINHPENKFEGTKGDSVQETCKDPSDPLIGKESNKLDETSIKWVSMALEKSSITARSGPRKERKTRRVILG